MHPEAIFDAWCPATSAWSLWVRPVLFAQMTDQPETPVPLPEPDVSWAPPTSAGWALVLDLPGHESITTGLSLAGVGYRPVPVFNVCTGPNEVIPLGSAILALRSGAQRLRDLTLPPTAPPAFLLDSRRAGVGGNPTPGQFDNRWQVFPQDFPSADALRKGGVQGILLVQREGRAPRTDLAHILRRWEEAGLTLHSHDLNVPGEPQPLSVERPSYFRAVWYRALAMLGLRRNLRGGFGETVPRPGSHG
jgi:hypothetical protein